MFAPIVVAVITYYGLQVAVSDGKATAGYQTKAACEARLQDILRTVKHPAFGATIKIARCVKTSV